MSQAAARESPALPVSFYVTVGLIAGAIIAYQIGIMRVFSVGTWSHFGSLVVSMAMLGFGVMSAAMCVGTGFFERHWEKLLAFSLYSFGPLMVLGNTAAQTVGFNPVELVANPEQKFNLLWLFVLYFVPFLPGALFLGLAFLRGQALFGRVYFADLAGSGLCGLVFLAGMYAVAPEWIVTVPLGLWLAGAAVWFIAHRAWRSLALVLALTVGAVWVSGHYTQIEVNQFKGISYARKFEDSKRIYRNYSPFGDLEVYASSYFHFAPGLSDNAAIALKEMPKDSYLGLFIDSDGPIGIIKKLPEDLRAYYEYLPMYLPYVLKKAPEVFVVQLGGGISTEVARAVGARRITVAEGNPAILRTLREVKPIAEATGNPLQDPRVTVVEHDGRLFVRGQRNRYDVIDLSLADSTGLSSPGGFAIVEKFNYTRETLVDYMNALAPSGVLSITLWNKEDLPKAVPKFLATVVAAARERDAGAAGDKFFILHSYLSTATVLYKRDGFKPDEIEKLRGHADDMSFEVLYYPGIAIDLADEAAIFAGYRATHFETEAEAEARAAAEAKAAEAGGARAAAPGEGEGEEKAGEEGAGKRRPKLSWANLYKIMIHHYLRGGFDHIQREYVFDTRPLTNERPYFAGYIKPLDIPVFLDQLDAVSDEWGYLLLWATLLLALLFGLALMLFPVIWGWRTIFSRVPGKLGIFIYYFCLGTGYIVVEVGLISKFTVALGNPAISASVLITGMLFFTGLGSLVSTRYLDRCRSIMPGIFVAISALLALGALFFDAALSAIGSWPYALRIVACLALVAPAAFLMGFPFATGMAMLSKLGKERFFIWAWGINGCFSVMGAVAVPIVSVLWGHTTLILASAAIYLLALPAFFQLLKPIPAAAPVGTRARRVKGRLAAALVSVLAVPATAQPNHFILPLATAPYPVAADARSADGRPFFDGREEGTGEPYRLGAEDRRYPRSPHFTDGRVLFALPPSFDPRRPFRIVVFFHGHFSEIERSLVAELDLPGQIARAGANAVLVAPQLARDAPDSSPGRWVEPGLVGAFLDEAARLLRQRRGGTEAAWREAPVVLAAFSGGYRTLAHVLERGDIDRRIEGVILLDAIYGDVPIFLRWLREWRHRAFFWCLYSDSSRLETEALVTSLLEAGVPFARGDREGAPAGIRFLQVPTSHVRVPVEGPPAEPLGTILRRLGEPLR